MRWKSVRVTSCTSPRESGANRITCPVERVEWAGRCWSCFCFCWYFLAFPLLQSSLQSEPFSGSKTCRGRRRGCCFGRPRSGHRGVTVTFIPGVVLFEAVLVLVAGVAEDLVASEEADLVEVEPGGVFERREQNATFEVLFFMRSNGNPRIRIFEFIVR